MNAILQLLGFGVGIFCIIQAFVTMDLGSESKKWPQCRGKLLSVELGKGGHVKHLTSGTVYYTYAAHGHPVTSNTVTFGPLKLIISDINLLGWASPGKEISQVENFYVKRGYVNVYYKPEDPQTSCLVPGFSMAWLICYIVFGVAIIGVTVYFYYESRKPPPKEPVKYLNTPPLRRR